MLVTSLRGAKPEFSALPRRLVLGRLGHLDAGVAQKVVQLQGFLRTVLPGAGGRGAWEPTEKEPLRSGFGVISGARHFGAANPGLEAL